MILVLTLILIASSGSSPSSMVPQVPPDASPPYALSVRDARDLTLGAKVSLGAADAYLLVSRPHSRQKVQGPGPSLEGPLFLADALSKRQLRLYEEKGKGVLVDNRADRNVYIPSGAILRGGGQDRMVLYDCLIPPGAGPMGLATACVEKGRSGTRGAFRFKGQFATPPIRRSGAVDRSSDAVHLHIQALSERVAQASRTQAYPQGLDRKSTKLSKWIRNRVSEIQSGIDAQPAAVGLALVSQEGVLCADFFGQPFLFEAAVKSGLLTSYVVTSMSVIGVPAHIGGWDLQQALIGMDVLRGTVAHTSTPTRMVMSHVDGVGIETRDPQGQLLRSSWFGRTVHFAPGKPGAGGGGGPPPVDTGKRERRPPPPSVTRPHYRRGGK